MEQGQIVPDPPKYDRSRPAPVVELMYQYKLPNCPGKSSVGLMVTFPPNSSTPPHTHAGASGSIVVLEGKLLNKMNNDPAQVFGKDGSWFEAPGCHHVAVENYSKDESAKVFAALVIDTEVVEQGGVEALVVFDDEFKDVQLQQAKKG